MKPTTEGREFPPCAHCHDGLVETVVVKDRRDSVLPLWMIANLPPHVRERLPASPTSQDLLELHKPEMQGQTQIRSTAMAACLCQAGRAKLAFVRHLVGLERLVDQQEIDRMWPGGIPQDVGPTAMLEAAGILPLCWDWTLENYRRQFGRDRTSKQLLGSAVKWVATSVSERTDVVIFGGHGNGKSGLAIAMLIAGIEKGERVRYEDARRLFMGWRETFQDGSDTPESEYLRQWETVPVLVIDEVQEGSDKSRPILQMLVDRRQKTRRPTVLILNVPEDLLDTTASQPFLAQALGPALLDRLREKAQFWAMFGKSRRQSLTLAFSKEREHKETE